MSGKYIAMKFKQLLAEITADLFLSCLYSIPLMNRTLRWSQIRRGLQTGRMARAHMLRGRSRAPVVGGTRLEFQTPIIRERSVPATPCPAC
jgi:hypothetical protein